MFVPSSSLLDSICGATTVASPLIDANNLSRGLPPRPWSAALLTSLPPTLFQILMLVALSLPTNSVRAFAAVMNALSLSAKLPSLRYSFMAARSPVGESDTELTHMYELTGGAGGRAADGQAVWPMARSAITPFLTFDQIKAVSLTSMIVYTIVLKGMHGRFVST